MLAPIVLFVYNRLDHTKRTIDALKNNFLSKDSELIIFSDGPKKNLDKPKIDELRSYLRNIDGFKKIEIVERSKNLGLAESIISGVTEIVNKYGKIIVLEDDLVTSPYFLKYMNEALDLYENEEKVISVHGYNYPVKGIKTSTFFLLGADCWGWATWKRGWDLFEEDGKKLLEQIKKKRLSWKFDFDGSYPFMQMLKSQIVGLNNSWAIRWYASAFLANKLTLYPACSLVDNTGFDNSGTHAGFVDIMSTKVCHEPVILEKMPVEEIKENRLIVKSYFHKPTVWIVIKLAKIKNSIKLLYRRFFL